MVRFLATNAISATAFGVPSFEFRAMSAEAKTQAYTQTMINQTVVRTKGAKTTRASFFIRKELTYFTENTVDDILKATAEPPPDGSGRWMGIARLALTPLIASYQNLQEYEDERLSLSTAVVIKLQSITFSASVKTIDEKGQTIGPAAGVPIDVPVTVSYLPPETLQSHGLTQETGDAFLVEPAETGDGTKYYVCGIGLTTRTKDSLTTAAASLQENTMTIPADMSTVLTLPKPTHALRLYSVKYANENTENAPTNTYSIVAKEWQSATVKDSMRFQEYQNPDEWKKMKKGDTSTPKLEIPLWGALQVQVPQAMVRGAVLDVIGKKGAQKFVAGVLNTNIQICVEVPLVDN